MTYCYKKSFIVSFTGNRVCKNFYSCSDFTLATFPNTAPAQLVHANHRLAHAWLLKITKIFESPSSEMKSRLERRVEHKNDTFGFSKVYLSKSFTL